MDIAGTILELLGAVAEQSRIGMVGVAVMLAVPLLPLAAVLIKPWRSAAFGVAIFTSLLWPVCVAFILLSFERLRWNDRLGLEIVAGVLPIAFVWALGLVVFRAFRAGIVASALWFIGSAFLLFLANFSWNEPPVLAALVGLIFVAFAWLLGVVVLGIKRQMGKK